MAYCSPCNIHPTSSLKTVLQKPGAPSRALNTSSLNIETLHIPIRTRELVEFSSMRKMLVAVSELLSMRKMLVAVSELSKASIVCTSVITELSLERRLSLSKHSRHKLCYSRKRQGNQILLSMHRRPQKWA